MFKPQTCANYSLDKQQHFYPLTDCRFPSDRRPCKIGVRRSAEKGRPFPSCRCRRCDRSRSCSSWCSAAMDYQIRAESGRQLLARLSSRPSLKGLDQRLLGPEGPLPHDVIEIAGENSVGKSMLALQWVARAILSPPRGGLGVEILFIDTDHHQPLFLLVQYLHACMKSFMAKTSGLKLNSSLIETSIKDALKRLTIINVYDSTSLYTALLALDTILLSKPQISMVVVDSLPAFYWADRLSGGQQHMDSYLKQLLTALQKSTKTHKVTVAFTRPSYFQSAAPSRFRSKDVTGGSTVFINLTRFEDEANESNTAGNQPVQGMKLSNLYCAAVRTPQGLCVYKYHITKDGIAWL